jgi:hypothetical protein
VPRYDRLQDTMQSLVDNLSLFNYRELLVRVVCWFHSLANRMPIAGTSMAASARHTTRLQPGHCLMQMGLAWILVLEVCKFVGRKHRRLIYVRAIGPLLVRDDPA